MRSGVRFLLQVRAPLRISLGGGGTDLSSYYRCYGGYFIAMAIASYCRVSIDANASGPMTAEAESPALTAFRKLAPDAGGWGVTSSSDMPPGSGLGSSGAYATALTIAAAVIEHGAPPPRHQLAADAYHLERATLSRHAGRQDTLVSAFGGLREYQLSSAGITATELPVPAQTLERMGTHLLLVDTGVRRRADTMLADQETRLGNMDAAMLDNLHQIKEFGQKTRAELCAGDLAGYASLMHEHWMVKRNRSPGMSTPYIDELYDFGLRNGALGGKLLGAGGGGFLLLLADDPARLIAAYSGLGVPVTAAGIAEAGAVAETTDVVQARTAAQVGTAAER
jgi:D-glycero-alpha-D-manno-heptose-7-phosphate kinase